MPEGADAATIEALIHKLDQMDVGGDTEEEKAAELKKVLGAIAEAANRLLQANPNEDQLFTAYRYRLIALRQLSHLGDEDAGKKFDAIVEEAIARPERQVALLGWQGYLLKSIPVWDTLDQSAKDAVAARILDRVKSPEVSPVDVSVLEMTTGALERMDDEFAVNLLKEAVPVLEKIESEEIKAALEETNLVGKLRRLTLLGKPMELSGELLGGGQIDWKSYRGKVVLVDFSATWCPPCVEEAPNVLKMYNAYKDRGFDVVAVSLDDKAENAQQYVKDNGIQWATIFPQNEDERGWSAPMVRYYGVGGIPTAILLDREGKAVHMDARDAALRSELERLLGPAEGGAAAPATDGAADPAGAAAPAGEAPATPQG